MLLAGVGQLASPIQAAWIFAHLQNQLVDSQLIDVPACPPCQALAAVIRDVMHLRDEWFGCQSTVPMEVYQANLEQLLGVKLTSGEPARPALPATVAMIASDHNKSTREITHAESDMPMHSEVPCHEPDEANVNDSLITEEDRAPSAMVVVHPTPIDEATGAVNAFASGNMHSNAHSNTHFDDITPTMPMEPTEVMPPAVGIAQEILSGKLVVVDADESQVTMLQYQPGMTVQHLQAADQQLTGSPIIVHNCLGHQLASTAPLDQYQLVIRAKQPMSFPLDLQELAANNCGKTRQDALLHQGGAVAADEMSFYLTGLLQMIDGSS